MPQTLHHIVHTDQDLADACVLVGWWQLATGALVIVGFQGDQGSLVHHIDSVGQLPYDGVKFSIIQGC